MVPQENPEFRAQKTLDNFYEKIRRHIKESNSCADRDVDRKPNIEIEGVDEGNLYGKITKDEFEKILESYGNQQECTDKKDKPVTCDKVIGDSYAKLLYSRKAFHHFGSTKYLSQSLGINDTNRESFLAGLSKYGVNNCEDVRGLRKHHLKLSVRVRLDKAKEYLAKEPSPSMTGAKGEIDEALKLNPKSADALALKARYYSMKRMHKEAVRDFREAFTHEFEDENRQSMVIQFADALTHYGLSLYHRNDYKTAYSQFDEALKLNPDNENAKIHGNLCLDKLRSGNSFRSSHTYRK